jgi:hypothetical protein
VSPSPIANSHCVRERAEIRCHVICTLGIDDIALVIVDQEIDCSLDAVGGGTGHAGRYAPDTTVGAARHAPHHQRMVPAPPEAAPSNPICDNPLPSVSHPSTTKVFSLMLAET